MAGFMNPLGRKINKDHMNTLRQQLAQAQDTLVNKLMEIFVAAFRDIYSGISGSPPVKARSKPKKAPKRMSKKAPKTAPVHIGKTIRDNFGGFYSRKVAKAAPLGPSPKAQATIKAVGPEGRFVLTAFDGRTWTATRKRDLVRTAKRKGLSFVEI